METKPTCLGMNSQPAKRSIRRLRCPLYKGGREWLAFRILSSFTILMIVTMIWAMPGLYYDRKRKLYYFSQTRQWYASLGDARAHAPLPQAAPAAPQQQQQQQRQRAAAQQQSQLVPKSRVESTAGKGGPVKIGSTKISKHGSKDPYMKSVKQKVERGQRRDDDNSVTSAHLVSIGE